jgi:kinesin family protein 4/21/27
MLIKEIAALKIEVDEEQTEHLPETENTEIEIDGEESDIGTIDKEFEIDATEEDKHEDLKVQTELFNREKEVDSMDTALARKQELLDAIVESNKEMKKSIVDTMKQEYLKKIIALQNEIKKLESHKERDLKKAKNDTSKTSVNNEYKGKIKLMEKELKSLKKKDKDQVDNLRASKKQKEQIKLLSEEIDGMKTQKVKMMRQIKQDKEEHRKWKTEKTKIIIQMKRANLKKDKEIVNLKKENSKKANFLRRKVEELKALQSRQKLDVTKHRKALQQKRKLKRIDPDKIKTWVKDNTQKLMRYQDIKEEMEKETKVKNETEKEIEEEQSQFAIIQTRNEKLAVKRKLVNPDDKDSIEDIESELRGYELELNSINENMNSLEDKLEFVNEKISVFNKEIIEINPEGIECLRFEEITNLEEAKVYLGSFFNIFLEMNVYRSMVENRILEQDDNLEQYKKEIGELNSKLQASEVKFREEISKYKPLNLFR